MIRTQFVLSVAVILAATVVGISVIWPIEEKPVNLDSNLSEQVRMIDQLTDGLGTWTSRGVMRSGSGAVPTKLTGTSRSVLTPNRRAIVTTGSSKMDRSEYRYISVTRWRPDKKEFEVTETSSNGPTIRMRLSVNGRESHTFWSRTIPEGVENIIDVTIKDSPKRSHTRSFIGMKDTEMRLVYEGVSEQVSKD